MGIADIKRTNAQSFAAFLTVTAPLFCGRPHIYQLCHAPVGTEEHPPKSSILPSPRRPGAASAAGAGACAGLSRKPPFPLRLKFLMVLYDKTPPWEHYPRMVSVPAAETLAGGMLP